MLTATEWPGIGSVVWKDGRIAECPELPPVRVRQAQDAEIKAGTWYESRHGEKRLVRGITLEGIVIFRKFGGVRAWRCSILEFNTWRGL